MEEIIEQMKIEKYSNYKDSGIEWLGEMPAEWQLLSNKYIFNLKKNQVGKKSGNYVLLSLTLNGVIKRDMENPQGKFPAEFDTYQEVKKGDFIFCLFDVEETPRAVGLSDYDGMITGAYTVLEPVANFDRTFLYYFYLNLDADKRMRSLYKGLRNTIPKESFFSFKTFVPPLKEQTAIASFLDRKTAQIDKAISIKEKQIELLKERRQILIHQTVTRGLNPNVKMKDSGVEWIGEIPEHWEVKKANHIFKKIGSGTTPTAGDTKYYDGEINWLQTGDLNDGFIKETNKKITLQAQRQFSTLKIYPIGSLVIAMYGATIGKLGLLQIETTTNQACCVLSSPDSMNVKFAFFWFTSSKQKIISMGYGGGQPNISQDLIKSIRLTVPPLEEQNEIINYLEKVSEKIIVGIHCKEKEIKKLKEYKATLINSAVTGKIKVSQDA